MDVAANSPGQAAPRGEVPEFRAAGIGAAFEAAFRSLVADAQRRDRTTSGTFLAVAGNLSARFFAECRMGVNGEGDRLGLRDVEAVCMDGLRVPATDLGMGASMHGLGVWTGARKAMETLLADGTVTSLWLAEVPNRMVRDSLRRRGYECVTGSGKDASYRAVAATPLRRD